MSSWRRRGWAGLGVSAVFLNTASHAWADGGALDSAWTFVESMATPRMGPASAVAGGRWFVGYGTFSSPDASSVEVYDPASALWTVLPTLGPGRGELAATSDPVSGTVLFAGGKVVGGPFGLPTGEADLGNGTAWSITSLLTPRYSHAVAFAAGKFVIGGGWGASGGLDSAETLARDASTWIEAGAMPGGTRHDHTMTTLSDGHTILIAGGGFGGTPLASAVLFDAATGVWSKTASMQTARVDHRAVLMTNGRVLVSGGISGIGAGMIGVVSAEIYDPVLQSWAQAAPMNVGRYWHSMVPLPDGRVLVAAGSNAGTDFQGALASVEVYDPPSDSWTEVASLQTARVEQEAAVLANGVYVTGGVDSSNNILASTERLAFVPPASVDAAAPPLDAPASGPDSTTMVDALAPTDAFSPGADSTVMNVVDASTDASPPGAEPTIAPPVVTGKGCGCRTASASGSGSSTALVVGAFALVLGRRARSWTKAGRRLVRNRSRSVAQVEVASSALCANSISMMRLGLPGAQDRTLK